MQGGGESEPEPEAAADLMPTALPPLVQALVDRRDSAWADLVGLLRRPTTDKILLGVRGRLDFLREQLAQLFQLKTLEMSDVDH